MPTANENTFTVLFCGIPRVSDFSLTQLVTIFCRSINNKDVLDDVHVRVLFSLTWCNLTLHARWHKGLRMI